MELSWLTQTMAWLGEHTGLTLAVLFLAALLECLVVVGLFMPGAVILFAAGALVGAGQLPLAACLAVVIAGALLGDGLSFWLGRRYGTELAQRWPLVRFPGLLERGRAFFLAHGGKSVFIARFVGPVRPVVPAVAGMLGMPPARFLLIDFGASLLWAPAFILPGALLGASLQMAPAIAVRLTVLVLFMVGLAWVLWTAVPIAWRQWRWHVLRVYRRVQYRPGPLPVLFAVLLRALTRPAGLVWLLSLAMLGAAAANLLPAGTAAVFTALVREWTPELPGPLLYLVGGATGWGVALAATVSRMAAWPRWWSGVLLAGLALLAAGLLAGGSALSPAAAGWTAAALLWGARGPGWLLLAAVAWLLIAAEVPPLALLAGAALAVACLGPLRGRAPAAAANHLLLPVGLAAGLTVQLLLPPVILPPSAVPLSAETWWEHTPVIRRHGAAGDAGRFRIQWQASRSLLVEVLEQAGWRRNPPARGRDWLRWLQPEPNAMDLPVLPAWHDGRLPDAVWLLADGQSRFVLRGWQVLLNGDLPLWLFDLKLETPRPGWPLALLERGTLHGDALWQALSLREAVWQSRDLPLSGPLDVLFIRPTPAAQDVTTSFSGRVDSQGGD